VGAAAVAGAAALPTKAKAEYSTYSLQPSDGQWIKGVMALIYFGMYGKVRMKGFVSMAHSVLNDLKQVASPQLDFINNVYITDMFEKMRDSNPDSYKMYLQASQDNEMPITMMNKVLRIKDNFIRGMSPELQRQYANELGHTVGMHESVNQGVAEGAPISGDGGAVDNFKQQMANNTELAYQKQQQGMAEGNRKSEPPEADYGADYQDMVKRVKKLAGVGPLKTQYDPAKRVYRNMPTAVQPKK
jgi:hypothetical protein